ncbi:uncharacterized protein LOC117640017 isoform X2 [Thrips palmi]|nr:uncharacterized protein LOC117640017 isoform X2 [Thrips palmi]
MKQLDDLLAIYLEHVTAHYLDCHKLPNKAAKLKRNINDTMIFFHMLYMDIREPLENAFYYDKMTELVAMYLDLEITASRRGKDTEKTVTNKLSTSLYTFLDHSEDHILDALLKTKLINKHSKKVCVPLLRKILSELVVRRPLAELTYVRFLLSFKLWKNVVEDVEERRAINKLAAQRLHPPPEYFLDHDIAKHNTEVLPRVPKNKKNCTLFYLGANFSVKGACYAFFRYCKDTNRANVYRRNIPVSEEIEKPFLISSRSSHRNNDAEESGSCSLINDIWSTISNGDSSSNLLGESDMFSEVHEEERNESLGDEASKKDKPHDSPDSGIDTSDRNQRKDIRKKKEPVPVTKFVMIKTESVVDPIPASSPAKGVQDCCLGSVFMMEQVNKVGGGHGHSKADVCESELPTSSRQHSVLESLVYTQPGSDNEAVASSSVSPKAGTVQTSHLDTNECDSSVEILQSRQISTDVSLPLQLKPSLNIDEELRSDKASKEDLLLFTGSDPVADDGGGVFESPFSDFNMFRDDLFTCRSFEDQPSMMYRRTDVTGSLPFQGSPLLEEDEEDFRSFRWTGVPDYASIQSTIINQSSGTSSTSDLTSCYGGVESKTTPEDNEEPKLGHDLKSGKGSTQGMLWHNISCGGKVLRVRSDVLARYKAAYAAHIRSRSVPPSQTAAQSPTIPPSQTAAISETVPPSQTAAQSPTVPPSQTAAISETVPPSQTAALSQTVPPSQTAAMSQTIPPSQTVALSQTIPPSKTVAVSQTVPPSQSVPPSSNSLPPPPIAISHGNGNNSLLEGSDNLKILAEEAVRVREASVAEAKCKSKLAANLNLPLKKRKSLASVPDLASVNSRNVNSEPSYPSAPMLSIAQVQGVSKSVIVMNSQYSWPSGRSSIPTATQVKDRATASATHEDPRDKPIDMSSNKITAKTDGPNFGNKRADNISDGSSLCKLCKRVGCQGICQNSKNVYVPSKSSVKCCGVKHCSGSCKNVPQTVHHYTVQREVSVTNKVKTESSNKPNGILKTRPGVVFCQHCNNVKCDGRCKLNKSSSEGVKNQRVHFNSPSKAVLKCFQCKSPGCNGKCMTSHSRCSTAAPSNRKTARCGLCKIPSCNGLCKTTASKCSICFSENCEGTCYLTGRSTNNSLSTVNDFSVLNSHVFADKQPKCLVCAKTCCGKCKSASATGFKYCPYCFPDVYKGTSLSHSVKSILGTSAKPKPEVALSTPKRAKASAASRRTRSSSTLPRQYTAAAGSDAQSFTVDDVKRRKKSVQKPVAR